MTVPRPPIVINPAANRGGYSTPINKQAICFHITDGTNSLGWLTSAASGVSANYLIDRDGTIHELVPWTEAAWVHGVSQEPDTRNPLIADWVARGVNFNTVATGIECEGISTCGQPGALTQAQAESLIALTAWLCQEQGHPCDRAHIIRHAQLQRIDRACCPGYDETTEMLPWIARAALLAGQAAPLAPAPEPDNPAAWYVPETDKWVLEPLLGYWKANGGLAVFGYPVTGMFGDGDRNVQYFERARLEVQPDGTITRGRVGAELAATLGLVAK